MKISYNWLKEYVDIALSPEKLARLLTMSGLSVESFTKSGGDYIFEIEVMSNRPDCLSYIGVAREVAALTGRKLKIPPITTKLQTPNSPPGLSARRAGGQLPAITIKVEDKALCKRYTGRLIKGVKIGESPAWLKLKIETMGLRPVNNIVDITNFCLFETGEPMHAFDLDKISGEVIIRRANRSEKIVTIDGVERTLDGSDLVIADRERPIAIAGVMGGLNTEVTGSTKNILLEAAYFDPVSIRRTSRRLGIPTESSYRFERRVDIENIVYSSERTAELILKIASGTAGRFTDIGKGPASVKGIELRYSRLNNILGISVKPETVKKILNALSLNIKSSSKDRLKIGAPTFRSDLQNEIDIIEEVARVIGYDKIPPTIPNIVDQPVRKTFDMLVGSKIHRVLTSLGLSEIITYGLISKKLANISSMREGEIITIKNPLSGEQEVMRPSLAAGMLNTIAWNINRKTGDLKLFELGNTYLKKSDGTFKEERSLSLGMTGEVHSNWAAPSREVGFFDLKGVVDVLFSELGVDSFSFKEAKDDRFRRTSRASIEIKGETIGTLGEVSAVILGDFDIKDKVFAAELCVDSLLKYVNLKKVFKELPKYPSVFRDISIIVGKEISNEEILSVSEEAAGEVLKEAKLIDRYTGKQIPDGKIGLTYRLEYQDLRKTLEEKEVSIVHSKVLKALEEKFNARLR